MSIEDIRALKRAEPFRPFEILTKAGETILIPLEHRIALSPRGESVAGFGEGGYFFLPISEIDRVKQTGKRKSKTS